MSPEVDVAFNVPGLGLVGVAPLVMERRNGSLPPMPWAAVRVMSWPPTADESFSSTMAAMVGSRVVVPSVVQDRAVDQEVPLRVHGHLLVGVARVEPGEVMLIGRSARMLLVLMFFLGVVVTVCW